MERLKILVVDDESRMRKLVRDFLVREDYEAVSYTHLAKKGDVLTVARVAGIMGTKQTSNLIPMISFR